jgi:predicted ATPase/class 3 adenylate cyclase
VTFLFTDIEGSTRLWDEHPDAMQVVLARHDGVLRSAIDSRAGVVFSTAGDGVAAAFQRAADAVLAAVEAQRALLSEAWPPGIEVRVRMGLHTGEAQERDGDYFGPPLNRTARLANSAHGGQIVVSSTTADLLWSVAGLQLVDLGRHRLRGISAPIHAFGVQADGVPWLDRPLKTTPTALGNLPVQASEWFGPVDALHRRAANLPRRRLVTLTGPGGVGKTRLAVEAAALASDEFVDGTWMVELAPIDDPAAVAPGVASTLSIQPQEGLTVTGSIVDWMRGRRLLLILDNCEHLLGVVNDLVASIVAHCPTATVLATSREPLGVPGERVVPVASLETSDAVELFCDRAVASDESMEISASDRDQIATICEDLDGIPLAIELAAARARSLSPAELRKRLGDRFRLLRVGKGLERHRTLAATVAWSYQLLSDGERLLFDRLSVFAGGFDVAAAEAVCGDAPLAATDVFESLASLVDKSMVVAQRDDYGTRYRLLETLRQYGADRLADRDGVVEVRDGHLAHFLASALHASRLWASPRQVEGDAIFERQWDNLRAAHAWAIATADMDAADAIVSATGRHARARCRHEHGDWAESTLELEPSVLRRAHCDTYAWAARAAMARGDSDGCMALAERGIDAAPSPDHPEAAACWGWLVNAHVSAGRGGATAEPARHIARAEAQLPTALARWGAVTALIESALAADRPSVPLHLGRLTALSHEIGAPSILSETARYRGLTALYAAEPRDPETALRECDLGVELARSVRDLVAEGVNLATMAFAATALRRSDAVDIVRDCIVRLYDMRFWNVLWLLLETAAGSFATSGDLESSAVVYGHLEAHQPPWGIPAVRRARDRGLGLARQHADSDSLMAHGAAMDRDELVAYTVAHLTVP